MILRLLVGTIVFLLVIGDPEPLDVAVGAGLCVAVHVLARRHLRPDRAGGRRPPPWRAALGLPALAWFALVDVVRGTVEVARVSLRPSRLREPGFVEVEIAADDASAVTTALLLTLSPGSFVVDLEPERGTMLVHVLDAGDPEATRAQVRRLRARQERVL